MALDSTGLKIYGEGEWKVRKPGSSKRRTWPTLHIGGNPDTGEGLAAILIENSISDAAIVQRMVPMTNVKSASGFRMKSAYASVKARETRYHFRVVTVRDKTEHRHSFRFDGVLLDIRAGDGTRTHDILLGKQAFYH